METPDQISHQPPSRAEKKRRKRKQHRQERTTALGTNPYGQPQRRGAGRPPRTPDPPDPHIDARQTQAYELHVAGRSKRAIAAALGVSLETIALDIRMEAERRAMDRHAERETLIATSASRYENVIASAREAIDACRRTAYEELDVSENGTTRRVRAVKDAKLLAAMVLHQDSLVKAQKALDRVLGIASPLPSGWNPVPPVSAERAVVFVLEGLPEEQRLAQIRRLKEQAQALGVAPALPK